MRARAFQVLSPFGAFRVSESLCRVQCRAFRTGMSEPPRRSMRLGGGANNVENEDPSDEATEALAQRAAEETRPAQLVSEQGIPANLYPDPGLPLTGPLISMTKEMVEQSKAEPAAPRIGLRGARQGPEADGIRRPVCATRRVPTSICQVGFRKGSPFFVLYKMTLLCGPFDQRAIEL